MGGDERLRRLLRILGWIFGMAEMRGDDRAVQQQHQLTGESFRFRQFGFSGQRRDMASNQSHVIDRLHMNGVIGVLELA